MNGKLGLRSAVLSLVLLLLMLGVWEGLSTTPAASEAISEYDLLMGGASDEARIPPPSKIVERAVEELSNPFYDAGPNDKGIGIQLGYSIYRVLSGFLMAASIAIPIGFLVGMSPLMHRALNPFIQILKPISPLAWMPLALFIIQDSEASAIFVIFICSIWPMLVNTAFGVANVRKDWINVARTHELGPLQTAIQVIVKSRMVINLFHKNFRPLLLPLLECLNGRDMPQGALRDVMIVDLTVVEEGLFEIL